MSQVTSNPNPEAALSGDAAVRAAEGKKKAWAMPPALAIVAGVLLVATVASVLLPKGAYERVERAFPVFIEHAVQPGDTVDALLAAYPALNGTPEPRVLAADGSALPGGLVVGETVRVLVEPGLTRNAVVPGTYPVEGSTQRSGFLEEAWSALGAAALAPAEGFRSKAGIIGFVILLGGAFGVMLATGALDRFLAYAVVWMGTGPLRWAAVPASMVLFSLGGAIFGMGESTIAFVLITVPLAIRLGFDTITGICMCYLASQLGFGGAFFNPFTVGIAQAIAELPYLSGNGVRYVMWALVTATGIAFVMWHAWRVSKDPRRSPTFALDESHRAKLAAQDDATPDPTLPGVRDWLVLACVFGSVGLTAYGVQALGWWIGEMAGAFVVCGVVAGLAAGFGPTRMVREFVDGAKLMAEPALIIAMSAGIVYVLSEGRVLDTLLHAAAAPLEAMGPTVAPVGMMGMQAVINFFVPSGSGQAAMTMPITAPLCDIVGVDRQMGVLAYQFGDGFGNMIIPTSAVLMGVLGVARVDWSVWLRWVWPLIVGLHVLGAVILIVVGLGPEGWLR
ncbi:MAG: TIGR00366 family protein [Planctomycetota bacterium]